MRDKVILVNTDSWGQGDQALGEVLLETFFTLLKQEKERPAAVFCMQRGVFALTENSLVSLHLKEIEQQGVPVLACKTCVEYYGIADKLYAGEISSMKRFMELSADHEVFTIG